MYVFVTLVPVFMLIAIGYILVKRGFIAESSVRDFNNLVYYIGLPSLLFYKIGQSNFELTIAFKPLLLCFISIIFGVVCGLIFLCIQKERCDTGSILQVIIRTNTVFVGLPVLVYFFEIIDLVDMDYINNLAMMTLALLVPINNIAGVLVFVVGRKVHSGIVRMTLINLITNPLIIACVAGVLYSTFFDRFAIPLERTFIILSDMTLPLSLIAVGCILGKMKFSEYYGLTLIISSTKLLIMPLSVFVVGSMFGFSGEEICVAAIFMACPTAATCVTLAQQLGGNVKLTSTMIFATSVFSVFSLSIVLILCKELLMK